MTTTLQANWIALILVIVSAFLVPYAAAFVRRRLTHATPTRLYAPHLVFLCTVRFAPMLTRSVPSAGETIVAFLEVLVIWAVGVSLSEWLSRRRLQRGA